MSVKGWQPSFQFSPRGQGWHDGKNYKIFFRLLMITYTQYIP